MNTDSDSNDQNYSLFVKSEMFNKYQIDSLPVTMHTKPIQANGLIRPKVWMLESIKPAIAATATNTAVQVPCVEREFRAMDIPSIPEPATKTQSVF